MLATSSSLAPLIALDAQRSTDVSRDAAAHAHSPIAWLVSAFVLASLALLAGAWWQGGEHDPQPLLARVPADLIDVLRYRSAYLWSALWKPGWLAYYVLLALVAAAAWRRMRPRMPRDFAIVSATLATYGFASIGLSWLLGTSSAGA